MLGEAAWKVSMTPGPMRAFFERVRARRRPQIAATATARKLVVLFWHLLTSNEDYAFARSAMTRNKIRKLEMTAGAAAKVECASAEGRGTVSNDSCRHRRDIWHRHRHFQEMQDRGWQMCDHGDRRNQGYHGNLTRLAWQRIRQTTRHIAIRRTQSGAPSNGKGTLLSFKCSGVLVDLEGAFLSSGNVLLGESFSVDVATATHHEGQQNDQLYTENGIEATDSVYSSAGGEAFGEAGRKGESGTTFSTAVKIIRN
jgi:hypothetical protein